MHQARSSLAEKTNGTYGGSFLSLPDSYEVREDSRRQESSRVPEAPSCPSPLEGRLRRGHGGRSGQGLIAMAVRVRD